MHTHSECRMIKTVVKFSAAAQSIHMDFESHLMKIIIMSTSWVLSRLLSSSAFELLILLDKQFFVHSYECIHTPLPEIGVC